MNVLILLEDALRHDAYYGKKMQPLRDYLGPVEEYSRWYTVNNCSDPSIATMLTGKYPWEHGVRYMGQRLWGQATLFDGFRAFGYLTMFSGWGRRKVIRGMDWDMSIYAPGHIDGARPRISPNLQSMLCGVLPHVSWFAFVRHMWCHAKYINGHYGDSVSRTAQDLIQLISWVRERFPDTAVIITADHGEFFDGVEGPHRGVIDAPATPPNHSWGLFEPQVHVPMVVSYPDGREAAHPGCFQHTDLMALAMGHTMHSRDCMLMEGTGVDRKCAEWYHRAVIADGAKLILGGKDGAQDPLLYMLGAEGFNETHNQAQAFPGLVHVLAKKLPPHIAYTADEEAIVLARLDALGYGE